MIKEGALIKWKKNKKRGLPCGIGSTIESTEVVRKYIEQVIKDYKIKSISDAPCGDFSWMSLVDMNGASYIGYDINDEMLSEMSNYNYKFVELDITKTILPKTDLIICRDCLFHLLLDDGVKAINNFKKSGSKYLMSTTFDSVEKNIELTEGNPMANDSYGYRHINLKIEPYNLGEYISCVFEPRFQRFLALWKIN